MRDGVLHMSDPARTMEPTTSKRLEVREGQGYVRFKSGGPILITAFLAVWLCGWAVGEVTVAALLLRPETYTGQGPGLFLVVWLIAWTIGGGLAAFIFAWMLFGEEVVETNLSSLKHTARMFSLSRARTFGANEIRNMSWMDRARQQGPFPVANPLSMLSSLSFDYGTRTIRIFSGIERAEAGRAIDVIRSSLGRRRDA
jgi:hypothetical protein